MKDSLSGKVEDTGKLLVQQFEVIMQENVKRLENLKHRLEITDGDYFKYWNNDAAQIVQTETSFKFVEWIDSTMVIERVEPYEGNEEAVGIDISILDYRNADWLKAKSDSVFNMTHWLKLTQGGYAFLVDEPVYIDGVFQGTITAGMDFSERFDDLMQGLNEYHVELKDDNGTVFYSFGSSEGIEDFQDMGVSHKIYINDANHNEWTATVVPNTLFGSLNSDSYGILVLVLGILLSFLVALSFFLIQKLAVAEQVTKRANQRLRAFINDAPIGIYVIDARGYVTDFWNPAAEKMLGWKQEEVLGNFLPHVGEEFAQSFESVMQEIKKNGGVSNRELLRKRKDGTVRTFRVNITSIIGDEEQMLVLFEDITREKKYEHQLEKSLDEKNILLSEIHHRVKNNLAIIVGLIELQSAELTDDKALSYLSETKSRIYSISGVHELLYQTEDFSGISFVEYINELVRRLQQIYDDGNHPVIFHKDIAGLSVNINQAIPLGLLLNELITNSYKHAFAGVNEPQIFLNVEEKEGFVEIRYEDNGKGVEGTVFEKAGSLGVTIIKTSLDQLHAEYEVFKSAGFGIRFRFPSSAKSSSKE